MITREPLVACAKSWIDTAVVHQGQRKGEGCDCKGLIVGVAVELGLPEGRSLAALVRDYPSDFKGRRMFDGLARTLIRVASPQPGDVLAILLGRDPCPRHLAFLTAADKITHAYGGGVGRVAEVPLSRWRVHSAWTWPSLGEAE